MASKGGQRTKKKTPILLLWGKHLCWSVPLRSFSRGCKTAPGQRLALPHSDAKSPQPHIGIRDPAHLHRDAGPRWFRTLGTPPKVSRTCGLWLLRQRCFKTWCSSQVKREEARYGRILDKHELRVSKPHQTTISNAVPEMGSSPRQKEKSCRRGTKHNFDPLLRSD